jgi:hypothetical protein
MRVVVGSGFISINQFEEYYDVLEQQFLNLRLILSLMSGE